MVRDDSFERPTASISLRIHDVSAPSGIRIEATLSTNLTFPLHESHTLSTTKVFVWLRRLRLEAA